MTMSASRKVMTTSFALDLEKGRPAMKESLASPSKEVGVTMVSFLYVSVETGWDSYGLVPSLL